MNINKFRQRNQLLSQQLEQIAQNEIAALKLQIRRDFDPVARDLLAAQERLLNAAERMLGVASPGTLPAALANHRRGGVGDRVGPHGRSPVAHEPLQ